MALDLETCHERLCAGLEELSISLSEQKINLLLGYLQELHKWNKAYNLSAIRDPEAMVSRHLLDSLALVPYLQEFVSTYNNKGFNDEKIHLIDVGTGAGLPGLLLAIVFPEINATLLDSNGKKTRFLFQTAVKLGLKNVFIENNRIEKFSPANKFAIVTSRAFASLEDMVNGSAHLLAEKGEFWAMKGIYPETELVDCSHLARLSVAHKLKIPECDGERHLIILKPVSG